MTKLDDGVTIAPDGRIRALYEGRWTDLDHLDVTVDDPGDVPAAVLRGLATGAVLAAGVWAGVWLAFGWTGVIGLLAGGVLAGSCWAAYEASGSRFEGWRQSW